MQSAGCGLFKYSVWIICRSFCVCLRPPSPEKSSQSSPLMLSGIPLRTSSFVFSVRYIHTPCPNSAKWFFHACSFRNSFAWAKRENNAISCSSSSTITVTSFLSRHSFKCSTAGIWTKTLDFNRLVSCRFSQSLKTAVFYNARSLSIEPYLMRRSGFMYTQPCEKNNLANLQ